MEDKKVSSEKELAQVAGGRDIVPPVKNQALPGESDEDISRVQMTEKLGALPNPRKSWKWKGLE